MHISAVHLDDNIRDSFLPIVNIYTHVLPHLFWILNSQIKYEVHHLIQCYLNSAHFSQAQNKQSALSSSLTCQSIQKPLIKKTKQVSCVWDKFGTCQVSFASPLYFGGIEIPPAHSLVDGPPLPYCVHYATIFVWFGF